MNPLKIKIYEIVKESEKRGVYDDELLAQLRRKGYNLGPSELNLLLLHMEIEGLIKVMWAGKGKRLIRFYGAG